MDFGTLLNSAFRLGRALRNVDFVVDGKPFQATVPGDSVFFSIKDILFNREYEFFPRFELAQSRQTVVDAGAHAGLYTIIASLWAKKVVALEPDREIFQILFSNIARNTLTNVVLMNSALWINDDPVRFYRRGNSQLGSVRTRRNTEPVLVDAVSFKRLLGTVLRQGREIDLLKLDVEGAEFDLIPASSQETLERISRMVVEVHTEHGNTRLLTAKLKQSGFSYVIVKRPFRKADDGQIHIPAEFRVKLLMRMVNLIISLSQHSDWSSLLLFASRERDDFPRQARSSLKGRLVETLLR